MSTYFKYAERKATDEVNWSEISSNMVNTLNEAVRIREEKKAAIDAATNVLGETLADAPQGEHQGLNEFALTFANNAQEMRLMQDKLLKSGQISLKDYNIGRANLTQGTTQLFDLSRKYQKEYTTKMERMANLESAEQEQWMMAELEGFANFSNHSAIINPTNGQVSVGKFIQGTKPKTDKQGYEIEGETVPDGVYRLDTNPDSYTTVQQLNFAVSDQVNRYNMEEFDASIDQWASSYTDAISANYSIDDVRQNPAFKQAKNDLIEGQLVDPRQAGSILTDFVGVAKNGKTYTFTRNPDEAGENVILLEEDPRQPGSGRLVPKLDEKQRKAAYDYLDTQVEIRFGRKETKKEPSSTSIALGKTEKANLNALNNLGKLYYGDSGDVDAALGFLKGLDDDIVSLERTTDAVIITKGNGNVITKKFKDDNGVLIPQDEWITSIATELTDIKDIKGLLNNSGYKKDKAFAPDSTGFTQTVTSTVSRERSLDAYFEEAFPEEFEETLMQSDEDDFQAAASPFFSTLGLTTRGAGGPFNDIVVSYKPTKDATAIEFTYDVDNPDSETKGRAALLEWIKGVVPTETIDDLINKGVISQIKKVSGRRKNNDLDSLGAAAGQVECIEGKLIDKETGIVKGTCGKGK